MSKLEGISKGQRVRIVCEGVAGYVGLSLHVILDGANSSSAFTPEEVAADSFSIEGLQPELKVGDAFHTPRCGWIKIVHISPDGTECCTSDHHERLNVRPVTDMHFLERLA